MKVGKSVSRKVGTVVGTVLLTALPAYRLTAQAPVPQRGTFAITNATIVPVVGERIPRGTIVIRDGRIAAVGASVTAPSDATVINGQGLFVYPGFIDSGTQLGLTEIGQGAPGGQDMVELGEFNPQDIALTAVNPHSELIPTVRVNGITTAITAPRGNVIPGYAALMDLVGWTTAEMGINPRAGMIINIPRMAGGGGFGGGAGQQGQQQARERMAEQTRALRSYLADAKAYADIKQRGGVVNLNLALEAMVPVVRGEVPGIFDVESADEIRTVLSLADSFGLRVVLRGASEAWRLADTLAARRIPVIVGPTTVNPGPDDPYDAIYANPGVLARAGVQIAFRTNAAADSRNLPYNAALATAYGLDAEEALRSITINPARIWGVADRYGSIETGKVANLIVTTGDPLDVRSVVRHLFIRGQLVPFTDRHTRNYEQMRARPRN
jgi:imidazolonepropionase-like amidohydrolase